MKYRKKPVIIEAYQYTGDGFEALDWAGEVSQNEKTYLVIEPGVGLFIQTLEGKMHVSPNDFIICGVDGEFYPCKPDIFEKTYESI